MAVFSYKALDSSGKEVKGVIEAPNKNSAYSQLKSRGIYPLELVEEGLEGERISFKFFRKKPSSSELSVFFRTLATLLDSGIPVVDAVNSFTEGEEKRHLRIFYKKLVDSLKDGLSFSESLRKAGVADPVVIALVSSGEKSALLPKNLILAAELLERREVLKSKIIQALIYPSILLIVAFGVVVFMLVTVIPKVKAIYLSAKLELPLSTKLLLSISSLILNHYFTLVVIFSFFFMFSLVVLRKRKKQFDRLKLRIPLIGGLLVYIEFVKFFTTFGDLLTAGVPAIESFETAAETLVNSYLREQVFSLLPKLERGVFLHQLLSSLEEIPGVVVQLIKAGENSGSLSQMSLRVAGFLENEVNFRVKSLTSLLEPATMIVVGVIIGFIVYALLLPILSISTIKIF